MKHSGTPRVFFRLLRSAIVFGALAVVSMAACSSSSGADGQWSCTTEASNCVCHFDSRPPGNIDSCPLTTSTGFCCAADNNCGCLGAYLCLGPTQMGMATPAAPNACQCQPVFDAIEVTPFVPCTGDVCWVQAGGLECTCSPGPAPTGATIVPQCDLSTRLCLPGQQVTNHCP